MRSLLTEAAVGRSGGRPDPAVPWHLVIEPQGRSGPENMALDQALLEEADRTGRALLRLYRFNPPCLSFGRNEPARERYDPDAIARLGIDVVRRPTGGRAVWHADEVTYAVAAPVAAFGVDLGRGAACCAPTYRAIHGRLAAALRSLGADATLAPDRPAPPSTALHRPSSCFASSAGGEVLIAGRKVIGSAQVRQGRAFLQHGSILLAGSQEIITAVSRKPQAASAATTLSAELGRPVSFDEVVDAIIGIWEDAISHTALDRPRPSATARFLDPAWTWRR
jgi:lipoyl(octanoyl) transferase